MDFYEGFQIVNMYTERDSYFGPKTNIKKKGIFKYFELPYTEERIVYYRDNAIILVFLDYWEDTIQHDLWENGSVLHLRGTGKYDKENDIELLNLKDKALFYLDRNDIAVHLFWADKADRYRYGHVMIPHDKPYQIKEVGENGNTQYVWMFPLLPVDVSYKMDEKYSFYETPLTSEQKRGFIKKTLKEICLNETEDAFMLKDVNSMDFEANNEPLEYINKPKEKQEPKVVDGKLVYSRDKKTAFNALKRADFECEIDNLHQSFIRKKSDTKYMEPHHLVPMAYSDRFEVSLDVEANIVSLCSNCHNQIHYGKDARELLIKLYNKRKIALKAVGIDITLEDLLYMYDVE